MKITGFQKTSLIDYPGHIVSIIFTQGCNFSCPFCHNPELINNYNSKDEYFPMEYIYSFLSKRKGLIDGISITGGEPSLQENLYQFIQTVKSMDLKVKLDTNGSKPAIIKELITDKLIDYIAMDIKGPLKKYKNIINREVNTDYILESITAIKKSSLDYEFRTTVVPGIHNTNDFQEIASLLNGSKKYFIQNFKSGNTLDPNLMNKNEFPHSKLKEFKNLVQGSIKYVKIRN
ncbi:anaerobic ribonucleoside-triphosphate reductase activating protein [Natronospora cellulosivora (SeqCode)]